MSITLSGLERFKLEGILGEGAELQVFAATDTETGARVVVKRAHPIIISRSQNGNIDSRINKTVHLRSELGDATNRLPALIAYTEPECHDAYFGDALGQDYSVLVEERARGLPLVGSAVDGIKKMPIGLPQKLFALHPLGFHYENGAFTIQHAVLNLVEELYKHGVLLLDLSPQNIFFDPLDASVKVIDIGNMTVEQASTRRREPVDLHNFYLEMFKWYFSPHEPPRDLEGYASPYGLESVVMFRQNLDNMAAQFSNGEPEDWKTACVEILQNIRERNYAGIDEFKDDFEDFLSLMQGRNKELSHDDELMNTWNRAKDCLYEDYWRKFLFDPEQDLKFYASR